jgi:hypothetical protein
LFDECNDGTLALSFFDDGADSFGYCDWELESKQETQKEQINKTA